MKRKKKISHLSDGKRAVIDEGNFMCANCQLWQTRVVTVTLVEQDQEGMNVGEKLQ